MTTGNVPIRGFLAGAIKWVVTRGFGIGATADVPGSMVTAEQLVYSLTTSEQVAELTTSEQLIYGVTATEAGG